MYFFASNQQSSSDQQHSHNSNFVVNSNDNITCKMDFVTIRKDNKKLDRNDLEKLTKAELIDKVMRLEAHNVQLKNIISKDVGMTKNEHKKKKQFDFSRASFRHVFLKLYYLGWNYQGFATQEDTIHTIEHHLFQALQMTCLIKDRESSNYHRCGRTDKGVSSFNQVISIDLRSKFPKSEQNSNIDDEINYCKIINSVLPSTIQCICWSPVEDGYSARFDCKSRTYKYFFPKGNLNIDVMKTALQYLIGSHDFRNFCKMDVANGVVTFIRNIMLAEINPCPDFASNSPYEMYQLTLKGKAFLWHQVRCIVAILLLIGEKKESPEVIKELLDVEKNPRKPNYNLASEIPLNLFYCNYEGAENWIFDYTALYEVISGLQKMWTISCVKTAMMKKMLEELEDEYKKGEYDSNTLYSSLTSGLLQGVKAKVYNPLMERPKCDALEDRIQHYVKKRRLVVTEDKHEDEEVMEKK